MSIWDVQSKDCRSDRAVRGLAGRFDLPTTVGTDYKPRVLEGWEPPEH